MDNARWFGHDKLAIPAGMKRLTIIIITIIMVIIILISFSSILLDAVTSFFSAVYRTIMYLTELLIPERIIEVQPAPPEDMGDLSFLTDDTQEREPRPIHPAVIWTIIGLFILAIVFGIVVTIIKFVKFILSLFKTRSVFSNGSNDVFTEVVEKIDISGKKTKSGRFFAKSSYSSLKTNRERIIYIYNKYVKRAKRSGFTKNSISDTPNEVLTEITDNANNKFPKPNNLNELINTAKYSNTDLSTIDTDKLKQSLL